MAYLVLADTTPGDQPWPGTKDVSCSEKWADLSVLFQFLDDELALALSVEVNAGGSWYSTISLHCMQAIVSVHRQ